MAILGALLALSYLVPYQRTRSRRTEIREILSDLKSLDSDDPAYRKAVRINMEFFRAIHNPFSYFGWLVFRAPQLRKNRGELVELLDMPFPKWQKSVLETLSWFEVWFRSLEPIKDHIIKELSRLKQVKKEPIVLASFGCGGMELERQIAYQLVRQRFDFPLIFIGIDYSAPSFEVIKSKFGNLVSRGMVEIKSFTKLDVEDLNRLKAEASPHKFLVVFLETDAFDLQKLPEGSFDLVYHTRLRHHLTPAERERLDKLAVHLSPRAVELDDVSSLASIIISSIFIWRFPAVLNGAIISFLRDFSKEELLSMNGDGWKIVFSGKPMSSYLRIYDKSRLISSAAGS